MTAEQPTDVDVFDPSVPEGYARCNVCGQLEKNLFVHMWECRA